jgi:hypothetical protein
MKTDYRCILLDFWLIINKPIGANCHIDAAVSDLNLLCGFMQVLPQL